MIKQIIFCDVCMREKAEREAGWWQVAESAPTTIFGGEISGESKYLVIRPYKEDPHPHLYQAACGSECLFKLVNGYVSGIQAPGVGRCA